MNACRILAEEGSIDPIPCLVMAQGDDAAAIEASLAENIERLPMDEIDQYKAFTKLIREGRSPEDIAATFSITERMVQQRLALGNLHPPILTAYRKDQIHAQTIRLLTLATPTQQKAWLKLFKSKDERAPEGYRLKEWLFGGAQIPTSNALFDLDSYAGNIISDLFGEDSYFDNPEAFWAAQNTAIAEAKEAYLAEGWAEVILLEIGEYFPAYDYVDTGKENGGKVYVRVGNDGEITFYEGQLSRKDIKASDSAGDASAAPKPELTKAMQNYLALHRHAAVRQDLLQRPDMALRLMAAHMIVGSPLWTVQADPQKAAKPEIEDSLAANTAQQAFEVERKAIAEMLGMGEATHILPSGHWSDIRPDLEEIFAVLRQLDDADITRILTFLMAESLAAGTETVEALAADCDTDMTAAWRTDETFFTLTRDKQALNGMVAELAGKAAAREHITATAKTQKAVIQACLDGTRIAKVENWTPRYMHVPMQGYTERSGVAAPKPTTPEATAIAAE